MSRNNEKEYSYRVLDIRGKQFSLLCLGVMALAEFSQMLMVSLEMIPSIPTLLRVFIREGKQ